MVFNIRQNSLTCILSVIFIALSLNSVYAHGSLDTPAPRGGLSSYKLSTRIDDDAPRDRLLFFPSGKKKGENRGIRSQSIAAGGNWTPFEPTKQGFNWRATVCGDERDPADPSKGDHMRGGKYYWPADEPRITATYESGGIIDAVFSVSENANHHGFIELHLCDVQKCGGEISEECFAEGHCTQLPRARNRECDSRNSKDCGPIDPNYPGRWYVPCRRYTKDGGNTRYGPGTMQFVIPEYIKCDHCVLHFYWAAANRCHIQGVVDYLTNENAPRWGTCPDEPGPAWLNPLQDCGGSRFTEEYYQCADIRIV